MRFYWAMAAVMGVLTTASAVRAEEPRIETEEAAEIVGQRLEKRSFDGMNLRGAVFRDVDFVRVSFRGADLAGATFVVVRFEDVDFTGADLQGATVINCAESSGVVLDGARLNGVRVVGCPVFQ